VSWQEAFETVLAVQGLGKVKEGDVFIVKTIDRMRKEEKTKADEAIDRIKRQNAQEIADQEKRVKDGRLPQISIEAKIVEVSRSGSRELGVLWGGAWKGSEIGFVGSNSAPVEGNTSTFALRSPMWDNAGVAVNVPSTSSALNPTLGVVVATSNLLLSAKLEALETSGEGKIISSPRVTTLDNEQAKIGQGEEIPYVTRDEDGVQKVEMKDAKLELEVTPKITSEGKISLKVIATNKAADWEKVNKNNENPPLVASNVESKVVISDGDTLVVGGIRKQNVTKSTTAVPWLSRIPVLGWLFKSESNVTQERELLIFVTPRIVKGV
jgi:type IV pilus assembly protein PilQ